MADAKTSNKLMEAVVDYKKGLRNLKTGSAEIARLSGLTPEIAAIFLKEMKRENLHSIRGYDASTPQVIAMREKARGAIRKKKGDA